MPADIRSSGHGGCLPVVPRKKQPGGYRFLNRILLAFIRLADRIIYLILLFSFLSYNDHCRCCRACRDENNRPDHRAALVAGLHCCIAAAWLLGICTRLICARLILIRVPIFLIPDLLELRCDRQIRYHRLAEIVLSVSDIPADESVFPCSTWTVSPLIVTVW